MKKSLLSVGAACFVAVVMTGCASTSQSASFAEEVKKAEAAVANARGLENHTKQAEKYLLPNLFLEQTKVLYIDWAAIATDSIGLRFGEADVISVCRDATDSSNLKIWDAMRGADKEKANAAAAEMKKFVAESYAKNKTTSKLSDNEMFKTVVGKVAQEDYVAYKKALKEGTDASDYKDQAAWLAIGKANINKVAAEQKKMMAAAEARLAKAEKEAEDAKRKISLTIKYYSCKAAYLLADTQAKNAGNPFLKKTFVAAADKAKNEMDAAEKEFPKVMKSTILSLRLRPTARLLWSFRERNSSRVSLMHHPSHRAG